MISGLSLVYGVGLNDADYQLSKSKKINGKYVLLDYSKLDCYDVEVGESLLSLVNKISKDLLFGNETKSFKLGETK